MDISKSVILPREDFLELQANSFNRPPMSFNQRAASALQTAVYLTVLSVSITAMSYGWAKAMDWLDQKKFDRRLALRDDDKKETEQN